jgi:antitoxin HicB
MSKAKMNEKHLGSSLDDFLDEEGRLAEAEAVAARRVLAFQIAKLMQEQQVSKAEMARRMSTSRAAVEGLLDLDSESATLATLEKAAAALGRRLYIALV